MILYGIVKVLKIMKLIIDILRNTSNMQFKVMSKRLQPRNKIDRRLGCNLWGEPKSPFNREYGPGQHGAKRENYLTMEFNFLLNKFKDL